MASSALLCGGLPPRLETLDLALPHWDHPELGLLTASTPNFDRAGIHQTGWKPGSLGQPVPGVALRVVDEAGGNPLALVELPAALTGDQRSARATLPPVLPLSSRLQRLFAARDLLYRYKPPR